MNYQMMENRLRDIWKLEHGFELTDLEEDYFIAQFFSRMDYLTVLEGGPWTILGQYIIVMKWKPKYRPSAEKVTKTLICVRFPEILPEMLEEETIAALRDMVGRIVKVDQLSLSGIRGKLARCCVEIDLSAPLVPALTVLDFAQKVEHESLHLICFDCGRYGH